MKKSERASIVRVLIDLIKADSIIDEGEMIFYAKLKDRFGITQGDEISASFMTLADAVMFLTHSSAELRHSLMDAFSEMTISDGYCAIPEAQLMLALIYCLQDEHIGMAEMYSIHEPDVLIEDNQVIYVESDFDKNVNEDIMQHYRSIDREFRFAGFHFVYIPFIVDHYKSTELCLFMEIAKFLAPTISKDNLPYLIRHLRNVTTADYCSEQLCNNLGISNLRDVPPSLIFKISSTHVGDSLYTNFLRITIDSDLLPMAQEIVDKYTKMLSSDIRFVRNAEEAHGQFLYHGFYKQLFDLYVIQRGVRSKLLIDFLKGVILLPDLSMEITGLHRRDKALYALLLIESENGGLDFSTPKTPKQKRSYDNRIKRIQTKYNILYEAFNGDIASAPNIEEPKSADLSSAIFADV